MPKGHRTEYSKEFKLCAVYLMKSGAYPPREVIRILNVNRQTVYRWLQEFSLKGESAFRENKTSHRDELNKIKKENENLRIENEHLRQRLSESEYKTRVK